jgi:hypothetical protein
VVLIAAIELGRFGGLLDWSFFHEEVSYWLLDFECNWEGNL